MGRVWTKRDESGGSSSRSERGGHGPPVPGEMWQDCLGDLPEQDSGALWAGWGRAREIECGFHNRKHEESYVPH